jgi:hypothetical protein
MPHTDGVFCRPPEIDAKDGTEEKKNLVAICRFPCGRGIGQCRTCVLPAPNNARLAVPFLLEAAV